MSIWSAEETCKIQFKAVVFQASTLQIRPTDIFLQCLYATCSRIMQITTNN